MSKVILQVNYSFSSSRAEHATLVTPMAEPIAAVGGLQWKIWLMNEDVHEAGGIYLFDSAESAQAFATSAPVTAFLSHPTISNVSAKMFEPVENLSRITRGPIAALVGAH